MWAIKRPKMSRQHRVEGVVSTFVADISREQGTNSLREWATAMILSHRARARVFRTMHVNPIEYFMLLWNKYAPAPGTYVRIDCDRHNRSRATLRFTGNWNRAYFRFRRAPFCILLRSVTILFLFPFRRRQAAVSSLSSLSKRRPKIRRGRVLE